MIVEAILNIFFGIVNTLSSFIPNVSWSVDSSFFSAFYSMLQIAGYLLPMQTVIGILELVILFNIFKTVISLLKTVWQLLPML